MRFNYKVFDAGWAMMKITCGKDYVELTASYLHDSLRDLASAVLALIDGAREATAIFMDESGEHHVNFRRVGDEDIDIEVLWYSDWKSWGLDSSVPQIQFTCRTRLAHSRSTCIHNEPDPDRRRNAWLPRKVD